jgi:preprotein translocase subunit YajC
MGYGWYFNSRSLVPIRQGDRVRTESGLEGIVKTVSQRFGVAYVQLDGNTNAVNLTLCPLVTLTKIEDSEQTTAS